MPFLPSQPSDERWIVQTLIEGHDLAVNVLAQDGQILAATVQHVIMPSPKPFQPAIGFEFRDYPAAMNVAESLIRELGWSGVANIDMRFDARHQIPLVLELNGRYWLSLLGSLNAGVNFPLLACEMCLGELRANRKPHGARYFYGKDSVLLSLVGGGKLRIRPHETNLRYFDPFPDAIRAAKYAGGEPKNAVLEHIAEGHWWIGVAQRLQAKRLRPMFGFRLGSWNDRMRYYVCEYSVK